MGLVVRIDHGDGNVQRLGFLGSPVRIGRNPLNEIPIDHPMISQWHAVIRFDETKNEVVLMDLGSTNGTSLNGNRLAARQPVVVSMTDHVFFGPLRVGVMLSDIPPELLRNLERPSTFDAKLLTGSATMFFRSPVASGGDDPKTVFMGQGQLPFDIQAVQDAIDRTRPAYDAFRAAWVEVERQLDARLRDSAPHLRQFVAEAIESELTIVKRMPEWKALLTRYGLSTGAPDVDPVEWLDRVKHGASSARREQVNPLLGMERVGALLETFADSFAALRRGFRQFGEDMALRLVQDETSLTRAKDGREVLAELLDWNADGNEAIDSLKRAFADLAMHQVAIIHGVVEGTRSMLQTIDPAQLGSGQGTGLVRAVDAKPGTLDFLPVFKKSRLWGLYGLAHRALVEEDRFTREIFGRAFARAYFDMTGGRVHGTDG